MEWNLGSPSYYDASTDYKFSFSLAKGNAFIVGVYL